MKIDDVIGDARTIGISGHVRPDGDCIGSCMGMYLYLRKTYPQIRVDVFLQEIPEIYKFIKDSDQIRSDYSTDVDRYDLFIALDAGKERLGEAERFFDAAVKTVNIDHHVSNSGTGDENYIVPQASSASELVTDVIDMGRMDEDIAEALYMGIICDTGVFKYSNTSPKTMKVGAELISYGFDFGRLIDSVFYEKTYNQNQILGRALLESTLFMNGRCIASAVTRQTMEFYQAKSSDLEGIVSQLMLTSGVDCAIFMYETGTQEFKVSLRSGGSVNVAEIAQLFGGGGHARAAGCTMNGTVYDVINNLSRYIEQQLESKE
ncbi:MAG: bifunctional oligoribonuclease/PAP phosphatase NrnA [Butyrivibrio sp.]|jgi:phosphoesterase RecJ-like protein|nr:bifunctional oligoribonuclease/PAP phosphatase NrnA [Butyrivibrio sp.]